MNDVLKLEDASAEALMGQIVDGIAGIREACVALEAPIVSGNVSLYNQTDERAIHPTPTIGVVGLGILSRPSRGNVFRRRSDR